MSHAENSSREPTGSKVSPVHERRRHKIAKNWPLLTALAQTRSSCPCRHTINFEKSEVFCTKKCGRPHMKNLFPLTWVSFMDSPKQTILKIQQLWCYCSHFY